MTRDAVVVGGALAGSLAALALTRLEFAVALVEARPAPPRKAGSDGRSISLSLASVRVMESLGLWSALSAEATPITAVHVSEAGRFGHMKLSANDMNVAALGQVVPAEALMAAINEAGANAGVESLCPAEVAETVCAACVRNIKVRTGGGEEILSTRLLVAADGAGSGLREELGICAREQDYQASAWVMTAHVAHPQPGVAFERFTSEGTLAFLPRAGNTMGVVWTLPSRRDEEIALLGTAGFLERVEKAMGGRLGAMKPTAPLRHFPLTGVSARKQTAERAVVLGNAAHALHPVAAQGFNLTVRDVAVLAECAGGNREDIGSRSVLERYRQARRRDQARTQAFTGTARRLGDWQSPLASPLRATGLLACELLRPLARECARQGMGLSPAPLPALVRGARL